jgi:membrane-associated phospholipid phosphatase
MPCIINKGFQNFSIIDWVNFLFLVVITSIYCFAFRTTPYRAEYLALLAIMYLYAFILPALRPAKGNETGIKRLLMFIYPVIFLFGMFESFFMILPYVNSNRYDSIMAAIDFRIFGLNPDAWFELFRRPLFSEILYIAYFLYFPMPLIVTGWMLKKRMLKEVAASFLSFFICYYGAYISYFLLPVQGPRFYLQSASIKPIEGLYLSESICNFINTMEPNKLDAFPSLHAAILLLVLIAARKYNRTLFSIFIPIAALITISLMYLRYHYAIDVIVGFIWAAISWRLGQFIANKYADDLSPHFCRRAL